MRFYSSPESANAMKVTLLAVIETVFGLIGAMYLARYVYESWTPLAIGVLVSPLFFLRTDRSLNFTLRILDKYVSPSMRLIQHCVNFIARLLEPFNGMSKWLTKRPSCLFFLPVLVFLLFHLVIRVALLGGVVFIGMLFIFVGIQLSRSIGAAYGVVMNPLETLLNIKKNWARIAFCIDSVHVPELVPGIETHPLKEHLLRYGNILKPPVDLNSKTGVERLSYKFAMVTAEILISLPLFIPTLLFRLSVKATSIVWLPLIWIIVRSTKVRFNASKDEVLHFSRLINRDSLGRVVVLMSCFTVILFLAKLIIYNWVGKTQILGEDMVIADLVEDFVAPYQLPMWQLAGVFNAALAIVMFFWASRMLVSHESGIPLNETIWKRNDWLLRIGIAIRTTLGLYTTFCLLYILMDKGFAIHLPPLGESLFPW
jgi:hypothetical protein